MKITRKKSEASGVSFSSLSIGQFFKCGSSSRLVFQKLTNEPDKIGNSWDCVDGKMMRSQSDTECIPLIVELVILGDE